MNFLQRKKLELQDGIVDKNQLKKGNNRYRHQLVCHRSEIKMQIRIQTAKYVPLHGRNLCKLNYF